MPPSRRPPRPCQRCNHMAFVRVLPREHSVLPDPVRVEQVSAPMYVTYWPARSIEIENAGVGLLETFICKKCGFVEWYCVDFERIPIHPHLMTEEVDYSAAGDGPYR